MARKNVVLQMKIENALTDIMAQTGADNVIVDSKTNEMLSTRLASMAADIQAAVSSGITLEQVQAEVDAKIDALIDGAPETRDTLNELAECLATNEDAVDALNAAIGNKVDKVDGMGLSANDFTDALLAKLNGIAEGATKAEASSTNGNIKINGVETKVYTHPTGAGFEHLPAGGTAGQVLRATGSGAGAWGSNVRSGATAPSDLAEGELFIKLV